jgi:hypothetical protein
MTVVITLNTDGPREPGYVLELAEGLAETVRTLNHLTRDHEALQYPSEAGRLLREVTSAVYRLDQLLAQAGGWLDAERGEGLITVTGGPYEGKPGTAVVAVKISLDEARECLAQAVTALEAAASVTSTLAARRDGTDD